MTAITAINDKAEATYVSSGSDLNVLAKSGKNKAITINITENTIAESTLENSVAIRIGFTSHPHCLLRRNARSERRKL